MLSVLKITISLCVLSPFAILSLFLILFTLLIACTPFLWSNIL